MSPRKPWAIQKTNVKLRKIFASLLLVALIALSLAGCSKKEDSKTKIGIALYQDSGAPVTALKNFLDEIKDEINCEFSYITLGFDEAENKSKLQALMASGVKGIISTMDSATAAIVKEAEKAGIYYGGYLCDFKDSLDAVKTSPNFVGTAVDGPYEGYAWGRHMAERMIAEGCKNIGMVKFPAWAYPNQGQMDEAFREAIAAYNATAAEEDKITVQETTTEIAFTDLPSTYFTENPDIDAIYGMCGGIDNIYPVMVSNGKTNIKLYTAGFAIDEEIVNNFGEGKTIQELVYSNVEAIVYPLVLILNKINGTTFADQPATAERVDTSQIIITTKAELDTVMSKSIYATGKASDAFLNAAGVKALLAANGGTYAKLVETVQSMSLKELQAK